MLHLTQHAEIRLIERNISLELVEAAVSNPDFTLPGRAGRQVAIKAFEKRFLKVIFIKQNDAIIDLFPNPTSP